MDNAMKEACTHVFATLDVKGRGYLTYDQMILALRILNFNPIESEIQEMLIENKLKEFNFDKFTTMVSNLCQSTLEEKKQDIREAFAVFDVSDSGCIPKEEFVEILTQCGEMRLDEKEATSWVNVLDIHKDGLLRISELEELFVNDVDVMSILNGEKWETEETRELFVGNRHFGIMHQEMCVPFGYTAFVYGTPQMFFTMERHMPRSPKPIIYQHVASDEVKIHNEILTYP